MRSAQLQTCIQVSDFVTDAEFAEPAERVANVKSEFCPPELVIGNGVAVGIDPQRGVAGTEARRVKTFGRLGKSLVERTGDPVSVSKLKLRTQFEAESCDVKNCQSPPSVKVTLSG